MEKSNEIKPFWTIEEAAEELNVPEWILRRFVEEGRIKAIKEERYAKGLGIFYDEYYLDYFTMLELKQMLSQMLGNEDIDENEAGKREGGLKGLDEGPLSNAEKLLLPETLRAYKEEFKRILEAKTGLPFKVEALISEDGHIDFYFGLDVKSREVNTIIFDRIVLSDDYKGLIIKPGKISNVPQEGFYGLNTIIEEALKEKGIKMKRLRCFNLDWAYVSEEIRRDIKEAIAESLY